MEEKEKQKEMAAKAAASYIREGTTIGLGTGSTVYYLIKEVGRLVREGMQLKAVATSETTKELAVFQGIEVAEPETVRRVDLAIDGVDGIDGSFCAVKGGGGALFREKIVASRAAEVIWIMDESKLVKHLGQLPLPLEILPFAYSWTADSVRRIGGHVVLRSYSQKPYRTDNGNFILDVTFPAGTDLREKAASAIMLPGVLETGCFDRLCSRIIVGTSGGVLERSNPKRIWPDGQDTPPKSGRWTDGYIGTYASEQSRGVYHFTFDTENGGMTKPELLYEAENAKWISLRGDFLAFPLEEDGRAGTCLLRLEYGCVGGVSRVLEEKQAPCYILQDEDYVYTANYHEGTVMVYRRADGALELVKRLENGAGAGCHQILLHGIYLLVPCLTQHRIRLFDRSRDFSPAGEIAFPEGTGPRHGVFNQAHTKLYVVSEWSNELFIFGVKEKEFILMQTISVIPDDRKAPEQVKDEAAEIYLTQDERFLYLSLRGRDLMAVLDVSGGQAVVLQHVSSGGVYPRDFTVSADERFLLTVNRFGGGIVCRPRDAKSGRLLDIRSRIPMAEGVALALADRGR